MAVPRLSAAQRVRAFAAAAFAASMLCAVMACTPPSRELQAGSYRATLETSAGELPFGIDVARKERGWVLYLVNGEERIAVSDVRTEPGRLTAALPGGGVLSAAISGDEWKGHVSLPPAGGNARKLPFEAKLGQTWLFFETPLTDNVDASGRFAVTYTDEAGRSIRGVAELKQSFEKVSGTFRTHDLEHRLTGEVHGDELRLAHFEGASGQLYSARADGRGDFAGEAWTLDGAHLRFVALRDPNATLDAEPEGPPADAPAEPTP